MALPPVIFATILIMLVTSHACSFRHISAASASCRPVERNALLDFKKHALQKVPVGSWFSSWVDPSNPTNSTDPIYDCCLWIGVGCDPSQGFVTGIFFNNCIKDDMKEALPAEMMMTPEAVQALAAIPHLSSLYFGCQGFSGSIPLEIGNLTSLTFLDLRGNMLSGIVPPSMHSLKSLQYLDLSNNQFPLQPFPSCLLQLPNLIRLELSANNFNGYIPDAFLNFTQMQYLYLSGNKFDGRIPPSMQYMTSLFSLGLSFNSLTGAIPADVFKNLTSVIDIELSFNSLTGAIPADMFMNFTEMYSLDLSYNNFTGAIPDMFASLTGLQYLYLSNNQFDGLIPSSMQNSTSLIELYLGNNHFFPQEIPSLLVSLPSLETLDLSWNNFRGAIPNVNTSGSKLEELSLSHNQLDRLLPFHMQRLLVLRLDNNHFPPQAAPSFLLQLPRLLILDLSGNNFTSLSDFPSSNTSSAQNASRTSQLLNLNLSSNKLTRIVDASIFPILNNLVVLDLSHNMLAGPFPTSFIPSLMVLNMNSNKLRGSVPSFIRSLPEIRVLDLGSNELNDSIPEWIGTDIRQLRILVLANNRFTGIVPANLGLLKEFFFGPDYKDLSFSETFDLISQYIRMDITLKGQTFTFRDLKILSLLDLSDNQLYGPIPPELGNSKYLVSLNLSGNLLEGEIPGTLGGLTNLESLDLSRNMLRGQIPGSLGDLQALGFLNLSVNHLRGGIPSSPHWLDTFNASCFLYNDGLCSTNAYSLAGLPVCGGESPAAMTDSGEASRDVEGGVEWTGFEVGYVFGILLGICMLVMNRKVFSCVLLV